MNELPDNWTSARLGDLSEFVMGQAPPGAECNKSNIGTAFVKAGEFGEERPIIREWTTRPLKLAAASDVLICVVGATSGKINLGADCAIGRSVAAIRPSPALDQRYLHSFLSTKVLELRGGSVGSAQGVIAKDDLAEIKLPLAPIPEQRRIVVKIDSLSAKSKRARDHLDHIPRLVEKYKKAILAAAFNEVSVARWERGALGDFIEDGLVGLVRSKDQQSASGGTPYIRMNHFDMEGVWNDDGMTFVDVTTDELRRYELCNGDILFNTRNSFELVGKVAVWASDRPGYVYNNNLLRLRFVR